MDFLPFTRPHIDEDTIAAVVQVLRSGWITTGPNVAQFEKDLAEYCEVTKNSNSSVKVFTSATGGLEIALRAIGIEPGDEVIVPAMTFVASSNVVALCGAKPVLTDVDLKTRNMTMEHLTAAKTQRTRVIMPVHFAGLAVDMDPLYDFAKKNSLRVLEDAAHAIGTRYKGRKIGSFGDLISFSFHPNKNMTTIEGGALVVNNKDEAKRVDLYRFHGLTKDNYGNMDVTFPAGKFNMPDVSAVVGIGQLKHLDEWCEKRRQLAHAYFERLKDDELINLPAKGDDHFGDGHAWHIFSPLINFTKLGMTRPEFIQKMNDAKIGIGVHYACLALFEAYQKMGYKKGQFPIAERIGRETVSLPLFPQMTMSDVDRVCETLKKILYS
jgi:dTDP-4-amino-4,6-dideoxygalactose transaminase